MKAIFYQVFTEIKEIFPKIKRSSFDKIRNFLTSFFIGKSSSSPTECNY